MFLSRLIPLLLLGLGLLGALPARAQGRFVNWENPHVHPLDLTPDGTKLLAVHTADNRLLVFNVSGSSLTLAASIPVGLDPVSVRARGNTEAWVVNHISDSVSIVDLTTLNVRQTVSTDDEPADVVFAGSPQRAFISCSQVNRVLVVDPAAPTGTPTRLTLAGEDPRALAVSADGSRVFAAIFESGNRTTILGGGSTVAGNFPPNVVSDSAGPYGGANPPPNAGTTFSPPVAPGLPAPPAVGLIVKKNALGRWVDDNSGDWTSFVSGPDAAASGRPQGWDLSDNDVAIIDTSTLAVSYIRGLLNLNMALAVHPTNGRLTVVGTDATNEVRFEPNLQGRFLRVRLESVDPSSPGARKTWDLNPHLTYSTGTTDAATRALSLGDPRGIAWNAGGTRGYITGMGSNSVLVVDNAGAIVARINVGEGPTGVKVHPTNGSVYVLNKFAGSVSVLSASSNTEAGRVAFFDPTPGAIKVGRKHLYDTRKSSGLGHIACGSCHIDGRMDRLAWDLGDPSGGMKSIAGQNLGMGIPGLTSGFEDWHPMKGPMTTQTLQDIIGKEPLHWRGDKAGLEEFNGAFVGLQGAERVLSPVEMQQFEDFLATLTFPPNPYRTFNNGLPTSLPLPGHYTSGRFGPAGQPLPNGNAQNGLAIYRPPRLLDARRLACVTCHTLPTGMGPDMTWNGSQYVPLPVGPMGEHHLGLVSVDGSTNVTMKIPQLRNMHEKVGFELTQPSNVAGFGFTHDGAVDSLSRFFSEPVFVFASDQEIADMVAFMLAFSGSELPQGSATTLGEPPGPSSKDTHAAVGRQVTLTSSSPTASQLSGLSAAVSLADAGKVGLVMKGRQGGLARGYVYMGNGTWQSDRAAELVSSSVLQTLGGPGRELTCTVVPRGSEWRIGVDRDEDGVLDRDELDSGTLPDDPTSN